MSNGNGIILNKISNRRNKNGKNDFVININNAVWYDYGDDGNGGVDGNGA